MRNVHMVDVIYAVDSQMYYDLAQQAGLNLSVQNYRLSNRSEIIQ